MRKWNDSVYFDVYSFSFFNKTNAKCHKMFVLINFNDITWTCYGEYSSIFRNYVVFLRRSKVSILIDD